MYRVYVYGGGCILEAAVAYLALATSVTQRQIPVWGPRVGVVLPEKATRCLLAPTSNADNLVCFVGRLLETCKAPNVNSNWHPARTNFLCTSIWLVVTTPSATVRVAECNCNCTYQTVFEPGSNECRTIINMLAPHFCCLSFPNPRDCTCFFCSDTHLSSAGPCLFNTEQELAYIFVLDQFSVDRIL